MSPEDREKKNGDLLEHISHQVSKTHEKVIRVDERLVNLNDRVTKLDKNVDMIRNAQQHAGTEVALVQAECARRRRVISDMHDKIESLHEGVSRTENTGRMLVVKTRQTWLVVTIAATVLASIAGLAIAAWKVF